jgi:2-oxo-3-hexenedioate decarboxylase
VNRETVGRIAGSLLEAFARGNAHPPISAAHPDFDVAAAYEVQAEIARRRAADGWQPVGRKIGFTNRTLWARYGVDRPMWAHVWRESVQHAPEGRATVSLAGTMEPRIEPEVVLRLRDAVPVDGDARAVLGAVAWIAPGFEIVQSHFPAWKFTSAECTAAFGLHYRLVVGPPTALDERNRDALAAGLASFEAVLRRDDEVADRGAGANVLGSPAVALAHLARILATQPAMPPLAAGEIVTTGTLTDAWPVAAGETWRSDYGSLPIAGLTVRFT